MKNNHKLKRFLKAIRLNESTISTVLGALVVVVVGVLIYNYFSSVNKSVELSTEQVENTLELVEENGYLVPQDLPTTHVVSKGEDLWKIAEKYFGSGYNWVDIAKENQLVNADILFEEQELIIPRMAVKQHTVIEKTKVESITADEYLVVKGDFLWEIAVRTYGDGYRWTEIWQANQDKIINPDIIESGTILTLPQ